jgi:hypothetical protein
MVLSYCSNGIWLLTKAYFKLSSYPTSNGICGALGKIKEVAYIPYIFCKAKACIKERSVILLDQDMYVCRT